MGNQDSDWLVKIKSFPAQTKSILLDLQNHYIVVSACLQDVLNALNLETNKIRMHRMVLFYRGCHTEKLTYEIWDHFNDLFDVTFSYFFIQSLRAWQNSKIMRDDDYAAKYIVFINFNQTYCSCYDRARGSSYLLDVLVAMINQISTWNQATYCPQDNQHQNNILIVLN